MKGRPYFADHAKEPSIRVILFLLTEKGNQSRFYQSTRMARRGREEKYLFEKASELCIEEAKRVYKAKLNQGYKIGRVLKYPEMEPINMIMPC